MRITIIKIIITLSVGPTLLSAMIIETEMSFRPTITQLIAVPSHLQKTLLYGLSLIRCSKTALLETVKPWLTTAMFTTTPIFKVQ